jgi:hypothetical protein
MLETLLELTIVVLSIGLLETAAPMVLVIGYAALILGPIGSGDSAFCILFHVLTEASFVDISILVPEYAFAVLLPTLEASLVAIASFVADFPLAIEDPIHKRSHIVVALPAALHLHQLAMAIEQACLELPDILRPICVL